MKRLAILGAGCLLYGAMSFTFANEYGQSYQQALPDRSPLVTYSEAEKALARQGKHLPMSAKRLADHPESRAMADLMAKMMQLSQQVMNYQQGMSQRVDRVRDHNAEISRHLEQLEQVMQMFAQQLKAVEAGKTPPKMPEVAAISQKEQVKPWQDWPVWAWAGLGALAATLLLSLGVWLGSRRRVATVSEAVAVRSEPLAKQSTKNEFDFMASSEAVPAKLDLARAYLAMDDTPSAVRVLQEVLTCGDEKYVSLAKELLDDLKQAVDG
jgi:FimV-like protein